MELRDFALKVLSADTLEDKLKTPPKLTDQTPGPSLFFNEPVRPPGMSFSYRTKTEKLPAFHELTDPDKRAICLHRFAGHELLAVEIMAHALLAFPEAPRAFRMGLANTLKEEQEHVRLYIAEMSRLGLRFGDLPQYKHFWCQVPYLTDPINYVSVMSLTFEAANLDFAPHYGQTFEKAGDFSASRLMARILKDEIAHVSFGYAWLKKFKAPTLSTWDAWAKAQTPLLTPKRAKGFIFNASSRLEANLPQEWVDNLSN